MGNLWQLFPFPNGENQEPKGHWNQDYRETKPTPGDKRDNKHKLVNFRLEDKRNAVERFE